MYGKCQYVPYKQPLKHAIRDIRGSNSNALALAKPNSISYALPLLPKVAPTVSGTICLHTCSICHLASFHSKIKAHPGLKKNIYHVCPSILS